MVVTLPQRLVHHEHATPLRLDVEGLLLLELKLDIAAKGHLTVVVLARLRVVDAQSDELTAEVALAVLVLVALLRVLDDALELQALGDRAVGIATIDRVHERVQVHLAIWVGWLLFVATGHCGRCIR